MFDFLKDLYSGAKDSLTNLFNSTKLDDPTKATTSPYSAFGSPGETFIFDKPGTLTSADTFIPGYQAPSTTSGATTISGVYGSGPLQINSTFGVNAQGQPVRTGGTPTSAKELYGGGGLTSNAGSAES